MCKIKRFLIYLILISLFVSFNISNCYPGDISSFPKSIRFEDQFRELKEELQDLLRELKEMEQKMDKKMRDEVIPWLKKEIERLKRELKRFNREEDKDLKET